MALDKAAVAHIAALARIRLDEAELEPLAAELSHILLWVEQLAEVDTSGVAPMSSVAAMTLPMREDEVTDGDCRDARALIEEAAARRLADAARAAGDDDSFASQPLHEATIYFSGRGGSAASAPREILELAAT